MFQKIPKSYFGVILGIFCPSLGKNEFPWKKGLCQFLNIPIIYHRAEVQKKLMTILEKNAVGRGRGSNK